MAHLKVLGTGSTGNSLVIVSDTGQACIVDLGLHYRAILSGVDFDPSKIDFALVSHVHSDHSKSIPDIFRFGIPVYGNDDVCENFIGALNICKSARISGWKVQTFPLEHNVPNNAFIIDTPEKVRFLYITDTCRIPYKVKGVHCAIVECNYDRMMMMERAVSGGEYSNSQHQNHLSIDSCIEYLNAIYSCDLQEVVLWHMSSRNIDPKPALERVKQELGFRNIHVGYKNLELKVDSSEF